MVILHVNKAIRNLKHIHGICHQAVIPALDMDQVTLGCMLIVLTREVLCVQMQKRESRYQLTHLVCGEGGIRTPDLSHCCCSAQCST